MCYILQSFFSLIFCSFYFPSYFCTHLLAHQLQALAVFPYPTSFFHPSPAWGLQRRAGNAKKDQPQPLSASPCPCKCMTSLWSFYQQWLSGYLPPWFSCNRNRSSSSVQFSLLLHSFSHMAIHVKQHWPWDPIPPASHSVCFPSLKPLLGTGLGEEPSEIK